MDSSDRISRQEKKIRHLELELNDLRQGLAIVQDYYNDFEHDSEDREAALSLEQVMAGRCSMTTGILTGSGGSTGSCSSPIRQHISRTLKCTTPSCDTAEKRGESLWNRKCLNLYLPAWRIPVPYLTGANGRDAGSCPTENNYPAFS